MDPLDILLVRFHFGGEFDYDGHSLKYVHGRVELSHIERDKLSLPELRGFLGDHVNLTVEDIVDFHWLSPGADLSNGLRRLADDKSCNLMSDSITDGGVAEVYVEIYKLVGGELAIWTPAGAKDMMSTNPKHWSRAWFNLGSNCDSVDNNMCESFNNWIVDVRAYPIISMLEGIRTKVFVRIQQNKTKSGNWSSRICPNILQKLNKYINLAQNCSALWNGKDGFEVKEWDKRYIVDIEKRTCSCRYWQLAGIPCAHAITTLFLSSKPPEDYIADCYSVEQYNKIYDHCMMPMEGMQQWPIDHRKPKPPAYVKMPGRPRKERRREQGEAKKATKMSKLGSKGKCSRCHKTGHNSRTCGPNAKSKKSKRKIMEKGKEVLECNRPQKKARDTTGSQSN